MCQIQQPFASLASLNVEHSAARISFCSQMRLLQKYRQDLHGTRRSPELKALALGQLQSLESWYYAILMFFPMELLGLSGQSQMSTEDRRTRGSLVKDGGRSAPSPVGTCGERSETYNSVNTNA